MHKKLIFLATLSLCFFGVLASAQTTTTGISVSKFEATSVECQPKMMTIPLVANLVVTKQTSVTFSSKGTISVPRRYNTQTDAAYLEEIRNTINYRITELKAKALFEFAEQENADVIVSPVYSVTTESSNASVINVVIKIKGFPAKYTNIRSVTPEDNILVDMNNRIGSGKDVRVLTSGSRTDTVKEVKL
ncbi:MAG: hypothetical protein J5835_04850 [Bacteroidales bacterium]|nr:hypothetical protein [Bacteroidales bacterium]